MCTRRWPQQTLPALRGRGGVHGWRPWVSPSPSRKTRQPCAFGSRRSTPAGGWPASPAPAPLSRVWLVLSSWVSSLPPAPGAQCTCAGPTWCPSLHL